MKYTLQKVVSSTLLFYPSWIKEQEEYAEKDQKTTLPALLVLLLCSLVGFCSHTKKKDGTKKIRQIELDLAVDAWSGESIKVMKRDKCVCPPCYTTKPSSGHNCNNTAHISPFLQMIILIAHPECCYSQQLYECGIILPDISHTSSTNATQPEPAYPPKEYLSPLECWGAP